ncbi:MAG TPA: hypothetical protein VGO63_00250 [Candidatus Paceibacterota bacterium]|jgi:hypothetical protein|nr:hypothetical protein [Candidatus Paceibacterota bacterium]
MKNFLLVLLLILVFLSGFSVGQHATHRFHRLKKKLVIDKTNGAETIPKAKDVFTYIDPDFSKLVNTAGKPSKKLRINMYQVILNKTKVNIFKALGNPKKLRLTQPQIIQFCKKYARKLWVKSNDEQVVFFLFTKADQPVSEGKKNVFVATVLRIPTRKGGLVVHAYPFSDSTIECLKKCTLRFVIPKK